MYEFLTIYGFISLTHLFNQIHLAHRHYLKNKKRPIDFPHIPSVAVVIPEYNEDAESLSKCVKSVLLQEYEGKISVFLVDDGSTKKEGFMQTVQRFKTFPNFQAIELTQNMGKRRAQKHVFDEQDNTHDVFVTIDSDTILKSDAIHHLVQRFQDPKIGAVTGDVRAIRTKKFLSQLIDIRYWTAFHQERAAQSLFGSVLCCSGPLSGYRSEIISKVKEKYVKQKFLGQICTYGDDRHLTNLVLEQGYNVVFEDKAKAKTGVPPTLKAWLKQQARWNRSFYRELIWTAKMAVKKPKKYSKYMFYDLMVQAVLPFLLFFSILFMLVRSLTESWIYFIGYLAILVGLALIRGTYAFIRTGDKTFFTFPVYSILHITLLVPLRIYSILTLKTTKWGTR